MSVRKQDELNRQEHVQKALRSFRSLLNRLEPVAQTLLERENPSSEQEMKRAGRRFVSQIKDDRSVERYLNKWVGKESDDAKAYSWRASVIYQIRNVLIYKQSLDEALEKVSAQAFKGFQAITMSKLQAPYKEKIPQEIRAFLPKNIVVEVDESGLIQRISDRFENENLTLERKIEKMRDIVSRYNTIVRRVKKDLRSQDERLKLAALITSIIMETGIRPGQAGNKTFVTRDGEKIEVETFGAVTLGPAHVKFVRDNFARLEFVGKMGSVNTASISNRNLIKILREYVDKALSRGSKYIFVGDLGDRFTYNHLHRYFRELSGMSLTDFRKVKATEAILNSLKEEQAALYDRIKAFEDQSTADLKQKIVDELVVTFNTAIAKAQMDLSHGSSVTTVENYINPQVILRFLSTGRVDNTLKDVVLSGETYLKFEPQVFVERAMSKTSNFNVFGGLRMKRRSSIALMDAYTKILEDPEGELLEDWHEFGAIARRELLEIQTDRGWSDQELERLLREEATFISMSGLNNHSMRRYFRLPRKSTTSLNRKERAVIFATLVAKGMIETSPHLRALYRRNPWMRKIGKQLDYLILKYT